MKQEINIKEYLDQQGIDYTERNGELITKCVFNKCDEDSRPNEAHLYFNTETSQYQCKKCNETGNIITLAKALEDDSFGRKNMNFSVPKKSKTKIDNKVQNSSIPTEEIEQYHTALPERIHQYLLNRGLNEDTIQTHKIGFGKFYGRNWITIPIQDKEGNYRFFKLRKDPDDQEEGAKYMVYPSSGSNACLFNSQLLKEGLSDLTICEGEFDCMLLNQRAIPAVTSTAGAGTFKEEWYSELNSVKKVYLSLDKDTAGEKATEEIAKKLYEKVKDIEVYQVEFPDRMTEGKDITDYFTKYEGNPDELMYELMKKVKNPFLADRVIKIPKPKTEVTFTEWKETITKHFPSFLFPAEVCLSVVTQMLITDVTNPFGVVLVDVPSSGKTITLNFFSKIEGITYATDKFTPASFISNSANVKKEKLKDIDLLPRLQYKTFIIRDLATLFSKREDDLSECLGILTRVMDGEGLATDTGTHGQREYTGEYLFMLLAASTPIPPKVQKTMGTLGARLFFLNMNSRVITEDELVEQMKSKTYKQKEKECREITQNFIHTLWYKYKDGVEWDTSKTPDSTLKIIARCAKLLAHLRGVVEIWGDKPEYGSNDIKFNYVSPVIEQPPRINQLFNNITKSHALVSGRDIVNEEDLKLVVELTLDSAPSIRAKLFTALIEKGGLLSTSEVETLLICSKPTARKEMECLKILGIVNESSLLNGDPGNPEKSIQLKDEFAWFLSPECKKIRGIKVSEEEQMVVDFGI